MPFALRTALRHARRRPLDAALNVAGLAVGLALVALVGLYLAGELSVDRFHPDAERVLRLSSQITDPQGEAMTFAGAPEPLGATVRDEVPGVEAVARLLPTQFPVERGGEVLLVSGYWTDASFFDVFGFRLVQGDPATALSEPGTVVLTERAAERLTGTARPLGQAVTVSDSVQLVVTGVIADGPRSHLQFDALRPLAELGWGGTEWASFGGYAYARLSPATDPAAFAAAVRGLADGRAGERYAELGMSVETLAEPVTSVYLSPIEDRQNVYGDPRLITLLGLIALVVLAVAAVNFVNLATARSVERAREIGVRKALGAGRGGLVRQFLLEAVALAAVAGVVALALVALGLPAFNGIVGSGLSLAALASPGVVLAGVAVVVVVGVGAGLYPAVALARFRPVETLRGRYTAGRRSGRLRHALVVFQFAVSTALLVATLVVGAQLAHLRGADDGFDRERVLDVNAEDAALWGDRATLFKEAVAALPGVEAASWAQAPPGLDGWNGQLVFPEGGTEEDVETMETVIADADYAEALGLRVVAGRDLDERASDAETGLLLNESAARAFGWTPEEAVGKRVQTSMRESGEVVGVVGDYRHHGTGVADGPQVFFPLGPGGRLLVRAAPGISLPALREQVAAVWDERLPGYALDAAPLDAVYDAQYEAEERLARAFGVFAALAVVVACLGLFGLAAYAVQTRTKEVGVRKVLGATVGGLVARLSRDFAVPVVVGLAVAAPLTWWGLRQWLDGFAERVALTPVPFLVAGLAALAVALLTVSVHTVRAATADPVRALRSE